jgi:hypothetical protein
MVFCFSLFVCCLLASFELWCGGQKEGVGWFYLHNEASITGECSHEYKDDVRLMVEKCALIGLYVTREVLLATDQHCALLKPMPGLWGARKRRSLEGAMLSTRGKTVVLEYSRSNNSCRGCVVNVYKVIKKSRSRGAWQ